MLTDLPNGYLLVMGRVLRIGNQKHWNFLVSESVSESENFNRISDSADDSLELVCLRLKYK